MFSKYAIPRCLSAGIALLLLVSITLRSPAADAGPDELVSAYEKSCKLYERAAFRAEVNITYQGPAFPTERVIEEATHKVWRDGERWKFLMSRTNYLPDKKGVLKHQRIEERLYPEKGFVRTWREVQPVELVGPGQQPAQIVGARFGEMPAAARERLTLPTIHVIYGYIDGNNPLLLPEVLHQSKLSARKGQLDGKPAWVLEAIGKWGAHTLWLDPVSGYLPRRIEQSKKGADWGEQDKPVRSFPPFSGDRYYPNARLTERALLVDGVRIERFGTIDLLTGFTVRTTSQFDNGQSVTTTMRVRIQDVKLNPDFRKDDPFRITTPISNGTKVHVQDQPNIDYEWRDGKIVKRTNPSAR